MYVLPTYQNLFSVNILHSLLPCDDFHQQHNSKETQTTDYYSISTIFHIFKSNIIMQLLYARKILKQNINTLMYIILQPSEQAIITNHLINETNNIFIGVNRLIISKIKKSKLIFLSIDQANLFQRTSMLLQCLLIKKQKLKHIFSY